MNDDLVPVANDNIDQLSLLAVAIVPVDASDRVVLVRQDRPAVGGHVLELPAGGVAPGEGRGHRWPRAP